MGIRIRLAVAAVVLLASQPAAAELWIKSDLPLATGNREVWPRDCSGSGFLASCSRFALGNWRIREADCDSCERWLRITIPNFNGEGGISYAETEHETDTPDDQEPSGIILLETDKGIGLYAFEIGFRGGTRYVLLSAPNDGKIVTKASVLDAQCSSEKGVSWRETSMDVDSFAVATGYCVVTAIDQLADMARDALRRPPIETLEWVETRKPDVSTPKH